MKKEKIKIVVTCKIGYTDEESRDDAIRAAQKLSTYRSSMGSARCFARLQDDARVLDPEDLARYLELYERGNRWVPFEYGFRKIKRYLSNLTRRKV